MRRRMAAVPITRPSMANNPIAAGLKAFLPVTPVEAFASQPEESSLSESLAAGPVPVRATVSYVVVLTMTFNVALNSPSISGVKDTSTVQLEPSATD